MTPDGRAFELTLHGRDWPFALDRDALILLLQEQGREAPFATAWAQLDAQRIALRAWLAAGALRVARAGLGRTRSVRRRRGERREVLQQQRIEARRRLQHEEVAAVIEHVEGEVRQRLADARGIGGQRDPS